MGKMLLFLSLLVTLLSGGDNSHVVVEAFYIPGVNPHSYIVGEPVKLKVNKMTSTKTQLPLNYYSFPFCAPSNGPEMDNENLGEFLAGDRIQSSPYVLFMKQDMYCEHLCKSHLGLPQNGELDMGAMEMMKHKSVGRTKNMHSKMIRAIVADYHNNWIVDNLSSASKAEDDSTVMTRYNQGFPIGFIGDDPETNQKMAYVHNHVNIEIMYHEVETEVDKFRIVRFTVEPFSIAHDADFSVYDGTNVDSKTSLLDDPDTYLTPLAKINHPLPSCDPKIPNKNHTSYDMIMKGQYSPQKASGQVLFTYDVIWTENKELHWASRWDVYLSGIAAPKVHWETIIFSLVVVLFLAGMVAAILVRNLRRDFTRYSKLSTDEEKAEELEEFGWKLVHADVFRPPITSPMLLAVACGTGAQILCMTVLTIFFSTLGFLNPSQRGALVMAELLLFVLMGSVAGYVTARLYKAFKGKNWQRATMTTAFLFPGICFAFFFILNIIAWIQKSTDKVPFTTMLVLLVLWFGISTPLVFFGAYFGYKQETMEFPVHTSNIPRQIPDQPWFMGPLCTVMISGILPFGGCFVELYYILSSVWMEYYYYMFGFLFIVFIILILTSAQITILFTYFQLCSEDYHWWWRSFFNSGWTAVYVFLYSIVYFSRLETNTFATYVLYFGYMALTSLAMFLMMGCIGVAACLWFNKVIFASIKID